jgi:DNA-binding NtrC family response regulator
MHAPMILLTGHGDIPTSVRAMKPGALDFFTKPFDAADLLEAVRRAVGLPGRAANAPRPIAGMVGESEAVRSVLRQVEKVADTDATVLITGESGTGKELVARAIHERSRRRQGPLVRVNCAAIPETLFESELFGHARGAFTGAVHDRPGRFEAAHGGTLILDEIGEVPLGMQSSSCGFSRRGRSSGSGRRGRGRSTYGSWPPPTVAWRRRWRHEEHPL